MSRRAAIALLPALMLLSGCADARIAVPSLSQPAKPAGFHAVIFPGDRVGLLLPRNWVLASERAPLVSVVTSGPAVIALWRYRTSSAPPVGSAGLVAARDALVAAARAHDPGLQVIRSSLLNVGGDGAVELDAVERIDGRLRRVRSMHVYVPGAELVLDEYAPLPLFHTVDRYVFSPVRRSLRILPGGAA